MPAKARAAMLDPNDELGKANNSKKEGLSQANREYADGDGPGHDFPLSKRDTEELGTLIMKERKAASKLEAWWDSQKYAKIISCASSVIFERQQFECKFLNQQNLKIFSPVHVDIIKYRALAYDKLNQFQSAIDDATTGLDLLASVIGPVGPKDFPHRLKEEEGLLQEAGAMNMHYKEDHQLLLALRSDCYKNLGDRDRAFVDLRAVVALERQMGNDFSESHAWTRLMTLMAEMKIGLPRPHFTDDEIRAWNKELQIKEYSIKNRICSNCGENPSASLKLKMCGGCKLAWFCGSECLQRFWPRHKLHCQRPVKKCTIIAPKSEASVRAEIAKNGYYSVIDDNGPAIIVRDSQSGRLHESLSDQDVFFVDETQDPAAIQTELMRQLSLSGSCEE
jgi:tetratricopeptide (TPR) repeat protein